MSGVAHTGAAIAEPGLRFDHVRLGNGLTIVGEHNAGAQSVAAGYFVHTGARDESEDVAGVSHFLEHMMFKGTERRSAADINREFDEIGAQNNAFTSEERTVYYGAVLPARVPALLDLLTDMMRPALRQDDFDIEKNVILEEIAMYEDRPHFRVFELANGRYWRGHPLGNSVLGGHASIAALTREQMLAYFERRYGPGNITLVLSGAYDWDAVTSQVAAATAAWSPQGGERAHPVAKPASGEDGVRDDNLQRLHVATYAPGVAAQSDRRFAASLLASVVGDDSGSRLFWSLVDKGLADSASLQHEASDGAGAFVGYLSAAPERGDDVVRRYREVLENAHEEPPTADEWHRAQRKLATSMTLRAEVPLGRLVSLGSTFEVLGRYQSVQELVGTILETPLEAGLELLHERPFDRLYVFSLGPS